jgi:hypothetical protein
VNRRQASVAIAPFGYLRPSIGALMKMPCSSWPSSERDQIGGDKVADAAQ